MKVINECVYKCTENKHSNIRWLQLHYIKYNSFISCHDFSSCESYYNHVRRLVRCDANMFYNSKHQKMCYAETIFFHVKELILHATYFWHFPSMMSNLWHLQIIFLYKHEWGACLPYVKHSPNKRKVRCYTRQIIFKNAILRLSYYLDQFH